ncbi:hypothetical protein KA517_02905 [Candidatus Gracilibacteria bacterium]|nr:hypothetical protein [Candidatus Gracilibacteria bacterium]
MEKLCLRDVSSPALSCRNLLAVILTMSVGCAEVGGVSSSDIGVDTAVRSASDWRPLRNLPLALDSSTSPSLRETVDLDVPDYANEEAFDAATIGRSDAAITE